MGDSNRNHNVLEMTKIKKSITHFLNPKKSVEPTVILSILCYVAKMNTIFIKEAIQIALESVHSHQGGPFGAVIVKDDIIIGRGNNQVTHNNDPTAHAEIEAIRDACKNIQSFSLKDCTLYASSEPCPMCLSAIYWARIEHVIYANTYQQAQAIGFDDQFIYEELSLPNSRKKISLKQTDDSDALKKASEVFTAWDSSALKEKY
jgi:guanine deaminase